MNAQDVVDQLSLLCRRVGASGKEQLTAVLARRSFLHDAPDRDWAAIAPLIVEASGCLGGGPA